MSGLGALDNTAHPPDRRVAAASSSGIVDARLTPSTNQDYLGLVRSRGEDPIALWGEPADDEQTWLRHNPYDLVPALRSVPLSVSAGDGRPGALDAPGTPTDEVVASIGAQNRAFADRLRAEHVEARIDLYSAGTRNWVYRQPELIWPGP